MLPTDGRGNQSSHEKCYYRDLDICTRRAPGLWPCRPGPWLPTPPQALQGTASNVPTTEFLCTRKAKGENAGQRQLEAPAAAVLFWFS